MKLSTVLHRLYKKDRLPQRNKSLCSAIVLILLCLAWSVAPAQVENFQGKKQAVGPASDSLKIVEDIELSRKMHGEQHDAQAEYELAERAVILSLNLKDTFLYARALDNLGLLYRYHKAYREALPYHMKAFELVKDKPREDPVNKMMYANNAGLAARYHEQYDLAVSYYLQSLKLAEQEGNLRNIAIASNGLGNSLAYIPKRKDEALKYFERGLAAERQRNDSLGMAMNLLSITLHHIQKEHFAQAFSYLRELRQINESRNDRFGIAITEETYGDAYFGQGRQVSKAISYYQKAHAMYEETGNRRNQAEVLYKLARLQRLQNNTAGAVHYLERSNQTAEQIGNKSLLMKNAYEMGDIMEKRGDYKKALEYYKKGRTFEDSLDLARQRIEIAALTNQFEIDKKETHINVLQHEQSLKEELITTQKKAIQTQRAFLIILLAVSGIMILLGLLQYRNLRMKRAAERELQEKEKELLTSEYERNLAQAEVIISRMQLNPHFIFNCLNAINLLIQQTELKKASRYLTLFSRFVRRVLELPKHEAINLQEELELIDNYLKLEARRFSDDFEYRIETHTDRDLSKISIPPLLLQPFVENAIWHGLLPANNPDKELRIAVSDQEGSVQICIEDNGVGIGSKSALFQAECQSRASMGMKISQDRISQFNLMHEHTIALNVANKKPGPGTRVLLTIEN